MKTCRWSVYLYACILLLLSCGDLPALQDGGAQSGSTSGTQSDPAAAPCDQNKEEESEESDEAGDPDACGSPPAAETPRDDFYMGPGYRSPSPGGVELTYQSKGDHTDDMIGESVAGTPSPTSGNGGGYFNPVRASYLAALQPYDRTLMLTRGLWAQYNYQNADPNLRFITFGTGLAPRTSSTPHVGTRFSSAGTGTVGGVSYRSFTSTRSKLVIRRYEPASPATPYLEFFYPDGQIIVMEEFATDTAAKHDDYRVEYKLDPFDNRTDYTYSSFDGRLLTITEPDGTVTDYAWADADIAESYNSYGALNPLYTFYPAWANVTGNPYLTQAQTITHTTLEITKKVGTRIVDRTVFLFDRLGNDYNMPFRGARLTRIYSWQHDHLEEDYLAGNLYSLTPLANKWRFIHFSYDKNYPDRIVAKGIDLADTVTVGGPPKESIGVYEYDDGARVTKSYERDFGWATFTYGTSSSTITKTKLLDGTKTTKTYDGQLRVVRKDIEVSNLGDRPGMPWVADVLAGQIISNNAGISQQLSTRTWLYSYGACGCNQPTEITRPDGEILRFVYDSATGFLQRESRPNPADTPGAPRVFTTYTRQLLGSGATQSIYVVTNVKVQTGTAFNPGVVVWEQSISNTGVNRVDSNHGQKLASVQKSIVVDLLSGGTETVSDTTVYAANGTVSSVTDGNGVQTSYVYDVTHPFQVKKTTVQAATGPIAAETLATEVLTFDDAGRPLVVIENQGSAQELRVEYTYVGVDPNPANSNELFGPVASMKRLDGSTLLTETLYHYDRWGNVAARLERNMDAGGGAPTAHGQSTSGARAYLRSEWHYNSIGWLDEAFVDRRALNGDDSGTLWQGTDARMLRTVYTYHEDGLLDTEQLPNGATRTYDWDGYGQLFRTTLSTNSPHANGVYPLGSPTVPNLHGEHIEATYFYDANLDLIGLYEGTSQVNFGWEARVFTRNAAGQVTSELWPSTNQGTSGTTASAVLPTILPSENPPSYKLRIDYELDALGRVTKESRFDDAGSTLLAESTHEYDQLSRRLETAELSVQSGSGTVLREVFRKYSGASRLDHEIQPGSRTTAYQYDSIARVDRIYDDNTPVRADVRISYAAGTNFQSQVERKTFESTNTSGGGSIKSYVTAFVHDPLGRVLEIRDLGLSGAATPRVNAFSYYSTGATQTHTDAGGVVTRFLPDALGRVTEQVKIGTGSTVIKTRTEFQDYTGLNDRTKVIRYDARNLKTVTHHDFAGRPFIIQNPGANYGYDPATGTMTASTFPGRNTTYIEYDNYGYPEVLAEGLGLHTWLLKDRAGNSMGNWRLQSPPSGSESTSDQATIEIIKRDGLGQVVELVHGTGGGAPLSLPPVGFQSRVEFTKDSLGRAFDETYTYANIANSPVIASQWAGDTDFRTGLLYSNGLQTTSSPDPLGRLAGVQWDRGTGASTLAAYGHSGQGVSRRDLTYGVPQGQTARTYDNYGRVSQSKDTVGAGTLAQFDYVYDVADNLLEEQYDSRGPGAGGDRFVFDDVHRLNEAWLGLSVADMNGATLDELTSSYVQKLTYNQDLTNNRTGVSTRNGPGASTTTVNYVPGTVSNRYVSVGVANYSYDSRGNLIFDGNYFYVYDFRNRLTEVYTVVESGGGGEGGGGESSMLSGGSLTSGSTTSSGSPLSTRTKTALTNDPSALQTAREGILSQVGGELWADDRERQRQLARGELEHSIQLTSSAPSGGSPSGASGTSSLLSGGGTTSSLSLGDPNLTLVLHAIYLYDAHNRRLAKSVVAVGNTYFGYDGWREVEEYGIKLVGAAFEAHSFKQFVWGVGLDELLVYRRNLDFFGQTPVWQDLFAHQGRNESVVRLVDSSGAEVEAVEYDPYGRATVYVGSTPSGSSSVVGNPYLWNGRRLDTETGLIYVRNRYYSPSQGRFMTHDPNGVWFDPVTNGNGYGYGNNNPLLGADRNGEWFTSLIGAAVGAVVGAIVEGVTTYVATGSLSEATSAAGRGFVAGGVAGAIVGTVGPGGLAAATARNVVGEAVGEVAASLAVDHQLPSTTQVVSAGIGGALPTPGGSALAHTAANVAAARVVSAGVRAVGKRGVNALKKGKPRIGCQGPNVQPGNAIKVERSPAGLEPKGRQMTPERARRAVDRGKDVYAGDRATAEAIAGRGSVGPEIHPRSGEARFEHFHRGNRQGGHIFFGQGRSR